MIIPAAIEEFLLTSLGMAKDAMGKATLERALAQAMRREGVTDPGIYEKLFKTSGEARQRLIDVVVVGETWFFRDRGPFAYLARQAPKMLQAAAGGVLNILSAPCSTGEEPYSIAMTLLAAGLPPASFRIEGVDISSAAPSGATSAKRWRPFLRRRRPDGGLPGRCSHRSPFSKTTWSRKEAFSGGAPIPSSFAGTC
jgi:chemotaxis methyl-accepting protein methylase